MKSPMITNLAFVVDKSRYSEMQVLNSGSGYYIGTIYTAPDGLKEPGSRDSAYFVRQQEAKFFLSEIERVGFEVATQMLRSMP